MPETTTSPDKRKLEQFPNSTQYCTYSRHRPPHCIIYSIKRQLFAKPYELSNSACPSKHGNNTNGSKNYNELELESRENITVPQELEMHHTRSLGVKLHNGGINGTNPIPIPIPNPKRAPILTSREREFEHGSPKNGGQTGNSKNSTKPIQQRVPFPTIHSPEKRRRTKTDNQPQKVELVCTNSPLQDGGYLHAERSPKRRRLDDQSRSKRCLLYGSNSLPTQKTPSIQLGSTGLPVQLPTIRPVISTMDLHQGHTSTHSHTQVTGYEDNNLHRRHPDNGRDTVSCQRTHCRTDISAGKLGIHCEPPKINFKPNANNRISRVRDQISHNGDAITRGKNKTHQTRDNKALAIREPINSRTISITGQAKPRLPGHPTSSSVLQKHAGLPSTVPTIRGSTVSEPTTSIIRSSRGDGMVENPPNQMERETPTQTKPSTDNRDRRLQHRMGSVLSERGYGGTLVKDRESDAHQLPRTSSSNAS